MVLGLAPSSLIAYWPLTETSGTQAGDVSGNARHGTYSGVTLAQIAGPGASMGPSPLFDGINDVANIDVIAAAVNFSALTLSCWYRVLDATIWTDNALRHPVNIFANGTNWLGWNKMNTPNNRIRHTHDSGGLVTEKNTDTSNTGWLHGAVVVGSNTFSAYHNGVAIGAAAAVTPIAIAATAARIGCYSGGLFFWSGYLAHCALWSTALSAAQITTLATAR